MNPTVEQKKIIEFFSTNNKNKQLSVEAPPGERVIIVTRCINAFKLRVSETLTKYISSLLRVIKV